MKLVDVAVVSEMTGLARATLYRMAREGRIPAVRIGRTIRFDLAAIEKWMAKLPTAER